VKIIIGGIGNSSPNPLIFPQISTRLIKIHPVPNDNRTVLANSGGKSLQKIATIPRANPNPPFADRKKAELSTASAGRSFIVFSFTTFGIAIKMTPIKDNIEPITVKEKLVSIKILFSLIFKNLYMKYTNKYFVMCEHLQMYAIICSIDNFISQLFFLSFLFILFQKGFSI
tara:strand:- start:244 stop:756 length:513 start_codon:yes stop_codon:yes gene_type:complete